MKCIDYWLITYLLLLFLCLTKCAYNLHYIVWMVNYTLNIFACVCVLINIVWYQLILTLLGPQHVWYSPKGLIILSKIILYCNICIMFSIQPN